MDKNSNPFEGINEIVSKTMEQSRAAMENYFGVLQKGMSAAPWVKMDLSANTELSQKVKTYVEHNIASASEYIKGLSESKTLEDVMKRQTEFMQTQFKAFGEQAKDLGETAAKAATDAIKKVVNPSA